MTNELVSVLMDGECSASELHDFLDDAAESPALMRQWSRMTLVRDAMAGIPVQHFNQLDPDKFCASIMSQLGEMASADAPTAPMPIRSSVIPLPSREIQQPATARRRARGSRMGWAAAASVTLVALAGGRSWFVGATQPAASNSAIGIAANSDASSSDFYTAADNGTNQFGLTPVSMHYTMGGIGEATETRWSQLDPEAAFRVAADRYHLHLDRSIAGLHGYGRLASSGVSYETVSDSH
jgi:negative regulator of sigma E activity